LVEALVPSKTSATFCFTFSSVPGSCTESSVTTQVAAL
jgi:hypothetical protein